MMAGKPGMRRPCACRSLSCRASLILAVAVGNSDCNSSSRSPRADSMFCVVSTRPRLKRRPRWMASSRDKRQHAGRGFLVADAALIRRAVDGRLRNLNGRGGNGDGAAAAGGLSQRGHGERQQRRDASARALHEQGTRIVGNSLRHEKRAFRQDVGGENRVSRSEYVLWMHTRGQKMQKNLRDKSSRWDRVASCGFPGEGNGRGSSWVRY